MKLTPFQSIFYNEWLHNPLRTDYNIVMDNIIVGSLKLKEKKESLLKLLNETLIFRYNTICRENDFYWKKREPIKDIGIYHPNNLSDEEIYKIVSEPFDLDNDLLFRIHIIKLEKKRYRVICILPHLVIDGVSTEEIYVKWVQMYNDTFKDEKTLEEQVTLHQTLTSFYENVLEKNNDKIRFFWKKHLSEVEGIDLSFLNKPKNKGISNSYNYVSEYTFSYETEVYNKVRDLKYDYKITPYIFGQLVLAVLLHKISGQKNIGIPYPIAMMEGKELMYGAHVNTLIIDYRFDEDSTAGSQVEYAFAFFKELKNTKAKYLPIHEIVQYTDNKNVLDIGFAQTFVRDVSLDIEGITLEKTNHEFQIDLVNTLLFEQEQGESKLNYRVKYNNNILDDESVYNFISLYKKLFSDILDDLVNNKGKRNISSYHLLTTEEEKKLTIEWNNTRKEFPSDKTIIQLFEEQVIQNPDQLALVYKDTNLTYNQLNEKANKLALYLREHYQINPDDPVALYMTRSEYMLISILAVLKSGGAYVPIDTGAPADRISYMLNDTKAKVVITNELLNSKIENIAKDLGIKAEPVDNESLQRYLDKEYSGINIKSSAQPDNLAYIIYTSGTTGIPKGVMVEHRGVVNLASMQAEKFGLLPIQNNIYKRCLWFSNYVFDAHASELYTAIANGHSVYIIEEEKRLDLFLLDEYISSNGIQIATIPPALLDKRHLLNIETLVVAGDITNPDVMDAYLANNTQIINAYGPTEATVCSTLHYYKEGDINTNIGYPLENTTVYVLDKDLMPMPVGAIGELYVGGAGIARGYLNNQELTSERFINNPFCSEDEKKEGYNKRIYKTGDLVRLLANGELEYIGRNDFQVKIRGFRIELGEIESVLSTYHSIKQSVVITKEHSNGTKYLVGYYVSDTEIENFELSNYLAQSLPEYMIPSIYVHLTEMPMNVNGKIDRNVLPEPDFAATCNYVPPGNEKEEQLCKIYSEVLGLDWSAISVEDDFFKLGGDSIVCIQLVSRIRQRMNVNISVKDIFKVKTIRGIYTNIISKGNNNISEILSEKGILKGGLDLLPIQEYFFDNIDKGLLPSFNHWNQSFILVVPELDTDLLTESLAKLVEYHDAFRLFYMKDTDGAYSQYYGTNINPVQLDIINIKNLSGEDELISLYNDWQSKFDIFQGNLYHVGYVSGYSDNTARIHFAMHHLTVDAVSWRIIKNDLQAIYKYLSDNREILPSEISVEEILGEKGISYRQWINSISEYVNREEASKEKKYWESVISNIPEYNNRLSSLQSDTFHQTMIKMDSGKTAKLLYDIHRAYNTQVNDILVDALSEALVELTGETENYITLEGHGRENISEKIDISNTVGWFTTMYPVKLTYSQDTESIIDTKDTLRSIPNNGVGYGALFGYTNKELPRIGFNYLGQFDGNDSDNWLFSIEDAGIAIATGNKDHTIMSINCGIVAGELNVSVSGELSEKMVGDLAELYIQKIQKRIVCLENIKIKKLTSGDIDFILSRQALEKIQSQKEIEAVYLANSLQQGFIYHAINQGNVDDAYRTQMLWEYHNPLDLNKLKKAWSLTLQKYPSLRLRFAWEEELVQIIDKEAILDWRYVDISTKDNEEQQAIFDNILEKDRSEAYDLISGNLLRVHLIKRKDNFYHCIFSTHHAILDGWSNPLVIQYVHNVYLNLLQNKKIVVAEDKTYFAAQDYLQKNRAEHFQYWENIMSRVETKEDLSSLLSLQKRSTDLSEYRHIEKWGEKKLIFSEGKYNRLKEFCSSNGITMNVLLQYCWHKQLSIYTANNTTVVGMIVSGRDLPVEGIEQSVGLYINTLPVVMEHADQTVISLLKRLQDLINEVNAHSNIDLAKVQKGGERVFNSLFVFENYPIPQENFGNELKIKFTGAEESQDYPLVVTAVEQDNEVCFQLKYAAELFEVSSIDHVMESICVVIDQILDNPQIKASRLQSLSAEKYELIINEWNDTRKPYSTNKTTIKLFEERVKHCPDNIAVVYEDKRLSYREFNEKSNVLGAYLKQTYDIKPDDRIALFVDKSEFMLISIFAVLKAGAAYIPIDTDTPDDRTSYIVSNADVKVVLTDEIYKERLGEFLDVPMEFVDNNEFWNSITLEYSNENFVTETQPHHLAYVIYTSGTTGKPKGVMVEHRNINRLVENTNYTVVDESDNVLSLTSYQFDASIYTFFYTLTKGATLVLCKKEIFLQPNDLNTLIEEQNITNFVTTTPLLNIMVDAELPSLARLKYVLFGGEQASIQHSNLFRKNYKHVNLVNVYGPTEVTTYATTYLLNEHDGSFKTTVPIGKAISNTTTYILDKNLQPVPVGTIGELYLGGAGVARGYLNNPDLTSERFIHNPYQGESEKQDGYNGIIYKTGDLVRYLSDGNIEFLGRNDFQVKIRGFRIELGDIENTLLSLSDIRQCIVIDKQQSSGIKYLVAYYVSDSELISQDIHNYMSETLPDYMIPSVFIWMESLPLNINGKVDRRQLPDPSFTNTSIYIAPSNDLESRLCRFYSEVLDLDEDKISVEEDFFRLGGNSILAIKLVSKVNKELNAGLHVSAVFNYKTIRRLSLHMEGNTEKEINIKKSQVSNPEEQLLSFAQERLWFIENFESENNAYNIPLVFSLDNEVHLPSLEQAIRKIINRHEVLRSFIKTNADGIGYQQLIDVEEYPLPIEYIEVVSEDDIHSKIRSVTNRTFNLEEEYPIHISTYPFRDKIYMSIVIHHIVFDGWSTDLFIKEIYNYYNYFECIRHNDVQQAETHILPEIAIQYKDYALWQREYLSGEELQNQLDYWKNQLANYENLGLSTDKPRPAKIDYKGKDIPFVLDNETSDKLRDLAKDLNVSLYSLLLSGYYLLLSGFSNQQDIIVGTPVAGRHYTEISDTIGFFVNTLAMRQHVNSDQNIMDFIRTVGQQVSDTQQYQDLPFEKLVDELKVEKDLSRHPVFQVMFGLQSFGKPQVDNMHYPLNLEIYDSGYEVAKFDLTTMMDDSEDSIKGIFNYATSLFNEETIRTYIDTYCYILKQISSLQTERKSKIKDIQYLEGKEYDKIVYKWNETGKDFPADKTIVQLFEEQVEQVPDNIAVAYHDIRLTYVELNTRANLLAAYIKDKYSIKPDDAVTLYLGRSEYMAIAILAVMKAGAAYVPMDVETPNDRISYILQDTGTKIVLTDEANAGRLKQILDSQEESDIKMEIVDSNTLNKKIEQNYSENNLQSDACSNNLAYLIYTSGTTGKPKGVMVEHRGVVNITVMQSEELGILTIGKSDCKYINTLWFANYIFDAHVTDYYLPILNGHTVHILDKETRVDLRLLNKYIADNNVELALISPAILEKEYLLDLKTLVIGGESANSEIMQNYVTKGVRLINAYGPTEISVCSNMHDYQVGDSNTNIGYPVKNTTIYVLDSQLRPLPIGAIGELYIGGIGVTRGYLNNPELTNERFIFNPFQTDEEKEKNYNGRIYKTGDLVRYLPNGEVEYLGRNDFQVKIRGLRIELGEIETVLASYPAIRQAVVLAKDHLNGSRYLIGYYVSEEEIGHEVLTNYLSHTLPDYMVPSVFVQLEELPRTANGKLDRRALPTPEFTSNSTYIAPKNEQESILCNIYGEVLGLNPSEVSVEDDFFRLGGDSIKSIQLVNRIKKQLNVHIGIKDIFSYKTIRSLFLNVISNAEKQIVSIETEQGILSGNARLLPVQKWFFKNLEEDKLPIYNHWNQAAMIRVPDLNTDILKQSISLLAQQHDALRFTYKKENDGYQQFYRKEIEIPFHMLNVKGLSDTEINDVLTVWQSDFNIFAGHLFHVGYLEGYKDGSARIHIAAHHLIVDAVSWRIITNDLNTIYNHLLENRSENIAPVDTILGNKGSSYRQWSTFISEYKNDEKVLQNEEAKYWTSVVEGIDESNWILKRLRLAEHNRYKITLDKDYTELLLKKVHGVYNTQINDVLLTAFAEMLPFLTGSTDNHILLEGHGRENISPSLDINNTVGWFTCMYPVRLSSSVQDQEKLLISVKNTLRQIPNNGIGYGSIIGFEEKALPLIAFNYLGQFDQNDNGSSTDWVFCNDSTGRLIAKENGDVNILSLNGGIIGGELTFIVEGYLASEQIENLSASFRQNLEQLIDTLSQKDRSYNTLSDINFIIGQEYLDKIQSEEEIDGIYLANSLQQGFIYHSLSQGNVDDAYHTQMSWDYNNPLDIDKLRQAIQITQKKFEALRLRFAWDDELVQIISKESKLNWEYEDISNLPESEQVMYVENIIENDRKFPYNLAEGNLFRVYLLKRNEEHYTCVFSNHHAILDGWSGPVIINYIHDCYLKLLRGEIVNSEKDNSYSTAQKYLQDNRYSNKTYWDEYLQMLDSHENLNTLLKQDKKHLNLSDYKHVKEPAEKSIVIRGEQYKKLKQLCAEQGFTINAILHYCWHKQLNIYGDGDTTIVGMTISGRNIPVEGIEQSAGLYINTLPIIMEHKDEKITDAIKTLQGYINEANSRCDINLSLLQKGGIRMFNTLFVYENYPIPESGDPGTLNLDFKFSKEKLDYPLGISAYEQGQEINFRLKYAGELFNEETIGQLLDGVAITLDQILADNEIKARELNLINAENFNKIIYDWNDTVTSYPVDKTIIDLFEEQVERTPDNQAVVFKDTRLTYRQLNEEANRLAAHIKHVHNIQTGDLVALFLDKSGNMLIAILAILKAGGAYVPIDPEAPDERILYMVNDTKSKAVLTIGKYKQKLDNLTGSLNTLVESIDNEDFEDYLQNTYPSANLSIKTGINDLAYVIYTSGTTGKPKGVMVEHRGITNLATDIIKPLCLQVVNDIYKNVLWYSNYVFDAHAYEVFPVISQGHCLHILEEEKRMDFASLKEYISDNHIAVSLIPPALLDKNDVLDLEVLTVAGEVTSLDVMAGYNKKGIRVVNAYGPTETTVCSNYHIFRQGDINTNIGRAKANTTLYVLTSHLQPVPVGAMGELYIGGNDVARGYLNNEDLTKERFIENPFQAEGEKKKGYNKRIYKTGDLVRYLSDGNLEYMGRNDFQIKIRGFRIELGEIENALSGYSGIKQCVVLDRKHTSGSKYLVGYYISDNTLEHDNIHNYMSEYLPDYMIPSAFVRMDAFPLTVNGKLDRRAMPDPDFTQNKEYVAPRNETEESLCYIYAGILGLDKDSISVEEDFFRLGGNSILAIKLIGRINKEMGKTLHVSAIFTNKTIRLLSKCLSEESDNSLIIEKISVNSPEEQLLSFAQERLWFIENFEGGSNAYNIPIVFSLTDQANISSLELAVQKMIERQEVLRSYIRTNADGTGYQELIDTEANPFAIEYEEYTSHTVLEEAIKNTTNRVFLLESDYPIHVKLYRYGQKLYVSIVVHHIVFDGWSNDLLVKEILFHYNYYECHRNGQISKAEKYLLPEINIQYRDFALWQRTYLSGERLGNQLEYWKNQLLNYETLNLITDNPRPSRIDYSGKDVVFRFDKSTSEQLRELAKEMNISLYSLLLSAYYLFLSSYSNQKDIVVGTPVAGRHYPEIADTIGFFVNTLVLRQDINTDLLLIDYIRQVGDKVTEAQKYQDLPFEKLVSELNVEKDISRHPVFQVMFGLQSFGKQQNIEIDYPLEIEAQNSDYEVAKFDITTMIDDSGEIIEGTFNYATGLFNESTIANYIETYKFILKQFAALGKSKHIKVKDITYLDKKNYHTIAAEWNQTRHDYPSDKTLVKMFEEQVERTPENIAVVYEGISFTYRELNSRANRLATYLKEIYGIEADDLITLCMDRSENLLVAILAVLKAGGAYVPMDTHAPDERLAYMIGDTGTKFVLSIDKERDRIQTILRENELDRIGIECVDNPDFQKKLVNEYPSGNIDTVINPSSLAYVIYTSGTTGKPKGAMIEHRSVVNRIYWMNSEYPINETDKILQKTTYTFDVSVWELFWANWVGAAIVFAHPEEYKDNLYILDLISKEKITVMHFVPSMLAAFEETLTDNRSLQEKTKSMRYLFCSGEALTLEQVRKYHELVPQCEIHNLYGPTEATVDVLYYDCNNRNVPKILIGKPIFNTTTYVLDTNRNLLPAGAIGELYIGGDNVCRGYLNNKELTQERFLPNPFQTEEEKKEGYNSRIYKTGDLVRILADGDIEYIGRNDFQVKIRGFRIELEEIESQLLSYPNVRQSVVLAKDHHLGNKYLVGYYVSDIKIDEEAIRSHLNNYLPEYMVPSVFVHLEKLPLTTNGKLDRKALPNPDFTENHQYMAPESDTERKLCNIYSEILGIDTSVISVEDDFFRLGGNSILAIKLISKIRTHLNVEVKLIEVLNTNSLRALARIVESNAEYVPVIDLNKAEGKELFLMVHPAMTGCRIYTPFAQSLSSHYHCYGIDSYNLYNKEQISDINTLAKYYLKHVDNTLGECESYKILGWSLGGQIALEMAVVLEQRGIKNIDVYLLDSWMVKIEESEIRSAEGEALLDKFKVTVREREMIKDIMYTEGTLSNQPLSNKLNHTNVKLFKARESNNTDYHKLYPMNNIDSYLSGLSQLEVIDIACEHMTILEHEKEIANFIIKS